MAADWGIWIQSSKTTKDSTVDYKRNGSLLDPKIK